MAGFSAELKVSNVRQTVHKLSGAQKPADYSGGTLRPPSNTYANERQDVYSLRTSCLSGEGIMS